METLAYLHLALACDAGSFPKDDPIASQECESVSFWLRSRWFPRTSAGLLCLAYLFASVGVAGDTLAALKEGERGGGVTTLQQELKDAGYYDGPVTGYYGENTEAAVRRFQKAQGLKVDGIVGSRTVSALDANPALEEAVGQRSTGEATEESISSEAESSRDRSQRDDSSVSSTLKFGKRGTTVEQLQQELQQAGYYDGKIDGIYGSDTEAAVKAFQQSKDLKIDGIAGSRTLTALSRAKADSTGEAPLESDSPNNDGIVLPNAGDDEVTEAESPSNKSLMLRRGDRGSNVKTLQQRLQAIGYYADEIDGIFGSDTEDALRDFQRSQTLTVTGIANRKTLTVLAEQVPAEMLEDVEDETPKVENRRDRDRASEETDRAEAPAHLSPSSPSNAPLSQGDIGSRVINLQLQLRAAGYYNNGPVMGYFGTSTTDALMEFQKNHGLKPTGIADKETQKVLRASTAPDRLQAVAARTLSRGDRGPKVAILQKRLRQLGYYMAAVNGRYNDATEDALKGFQIEKKLPATGVADKETLDALGIQIGQLNQTAAAPAATADSSKPARSTETALSSDDRGEAVAKLQRRLQAANYYNGPADGIYGSGTEEAVTAFQKAQGLEPDGVAGKKTLAALSALNSPTEDN